MTASLTQHPRFMSYSSRKSSPSSVSEEPESESVSVAPTNRGEELFGELLEIWRPSRPSLRPDFWHRRSYRNSPATTKYMEVHASPAAKTTSTGRTAFSEQHSWQSCRRMRGFQPSRSPKKL